MPPALKQLQAGSKGYRIVSPGPDLDWIMQPPPLYLSSVYASNTVTASSTTDVAIPDMELRCPTDGWYHISFAIELKVSSTRSIGVQPYLDETTDGFTICWISAYNPQSYYVLCAELNRGSLEGAMMTLRWSSSGSTTMSAAKRRLTIIRGLGAPK